jgi:hypothetical protein
VAEEGLQVKHIHAGSYRKNEIGSRPIITARYEKMGDIVLSFQGGGRSSPI